MKRVLLIATLALLAACNSEKANTAEEAVAVSAAEQTTNPVISSYMDMKDALVASDAEAARESAEALLTAAMDEKLSSECITAIQELQSSEDLEAIRAAFYPLSQQIYTWVKNSDENSEKLYWQHCPMAMDNEGANWLSMESEILNPYFGDQMLHCGRIAEEL